ncbi:hypothetical protein F4805DRAFT_60318 [Annulohypoxylon moriforme]|nr:hypothetical protein F4805DRAFT_60318 [Annulohypoxylon moriforme]
MPHPLNFALFEEEQDFPLDMTSFNGPDEALLRPCPGSPLTICQRAGAYATSGAMDSMYSEATFEELKQRLRRTTEEKEKLEEWCMSKAQSAEKIAKVLLRKVHRLRVALQESELKGRPDAVPGPVHTINPPLRAPTPRRRPIVPAPSMKAEPACKDRSHQGIIAAFEQSVKHTTQAVRGEEARAREAEELREELNVAYKILSEERALSRTLTIQVEGIEKIMNIQHNDIKNHKQELIDMRTLVKALQLENARLLASEGLAEGGGSEVVEELEGRIHRLEGRVREVEELRDGLEKQLGEERKVSEKLGEMVKDAEKRVNAEWHELCGEWCKELGEVREGLTAFEAKLVSFLERQQVARESQQKEHGTQTLPQPQVMARDFTESSSPFIIDADWDSPALAVHVQSPEPTVDLSARVRDLERRNRDLEVELSNVRQTDADLAGFYPLCRFHRRVSPRMENQEQAEQDQDGSEMDVPDLAPVTTAESSVSVSAVATAPDSRSWQLEVPDMDEEIPELRLPVCYNIFPWIFLKETKRDY